MKKLQIIIICLLTAISAHSQISGNINNERYTIGNLYQSSSQVQQPNLNSSNLSIKGIANIKPDALVAIYSVYQVGKTVEETNQLMDERIQKIETALRQYKGISVYVDMISMVPLYEVVSEKKAFSKRTFNEVPVGFELKKNIHIQFKHGFEINNIMQVLSREEVYDLVRVDYTINDIDSIKTALMNKAREILLQRIKNYELIVGNIYDNWEKNVNDGFMMYLPTEMYRNYTAYQNSSFTKSYSEAYKPSTQYYMPIQNKDFDFTINPTILEPTVQVAYELKWHAVKKPEKVQEQKVDKQQQILFITSSGEVKTLNLK